MICQVNFISLKSHEFHDNKFLDKVLLYEFYIGLGKHIEPYLRGILCVLPMPIIIFQPLTSSITHDKKHYHRALVWYIKIPLKLITYVHHSILNGKLHIIDGIYKIWKLLTWRLSHGK